MASIARHHSEWLSLVEVSGPFLSLAVLMQTFPQGLDAHDPQVMADLRAAHGEWEVGQASSRPDPAIHRAWIIFVLSGVLGLTDEVLAAGQALPPGLELLSPEHHTVVRPDLAVINPSTADPDGGKPRLLIMTLPAGQDLERAS